MMGVLAGVDWGEVTSAELVVSTCGGSRIEVTRQLLPYMDIGRGDERGAIVVSTVADVRVSWMVHAFFPMHLESTALGM